MSDFVAPEDRHMLCTLVENAMAGPPPRAPGASMRLRHSTSSADTAADSHLCQFKEPFWPVDVKVCYDGQFLYCVMLDATDAAR